jgi:hypothetical protein
LNELVLIGTNEANDLHVRTQAAIESLDIIQDAMNRGEISDEGAVYITDRLHNALELAGVKIDGTQPKRRTTSTEFLLTAWIAWAAIVLVALAVLAVIR